MSYYPSYTALKCLEVSARLLSFTRAARELHLTQGAVSHHIAKLEAQLGVTLFERQAGGLALTADGAWFLQQVTPALQRIEAATEGLRSGAHRQQVVRLSVQPTFADYWLMPKLNRFSLDHPEICLDIVVRSGDGDGSDPVDAWFEQSTGAAPGVDAIKILDLIYKPYVSPARLHALGHCGMPAEPNAQALVDILRRSPLLKTTAAQVWENWLRQKGIISRIDPAHLNAGPRYAMVSLVLKAVMDGVGVALLPGYLTTAPLAQGKLLCLDDEGWQSDRPYYLRWPAGRRSAGLATLLDWMERQIASGML